MAPRVQLHMQQHSVEGNAVHEAVDKFGQPAVDEQTGWVMDVVSKRLRDGGIIIPHQSPLHEVRRKLNLQHFTCALPSCPAFNRPVDPGEYCITVELESNISLVGKLFRPLTSLRKARASPINGESNLRGKGETGSLNFHIACGETVLSRRPCTDTPTSVQSPTASLPMGDYAHRIRVDSHPFTVPGGHHPLDSPEIYSILKWIAVIKAEGGLAGVESEDFWSADDRMAAYPSQQQAEYVGIWHAMRVEVTAEQVKGQQLSTVLLHVKESKEQASERLIARQNKRDQLKAVGVTEQSRLDVAREWEDARTQEGSIASGVFKEPQRQLQQGSAAIGEPAETVKREKMIGEAEEEDQESPTVTSDARVRAWLVAQGDEEMRDSKPRLRLTQPDPNWRRPLSSDKEVSSVESASPEELRLDSSEAEASSSEAPSYHATHQPSHWDSYLTMGRNAFRLAAEQELGPTEISTSKDESGEATPSETEESSSASLRLDTPMVRFLVEDSDTPGRSPDSPMQEVRGEADESSSEEDESLDSWSDPEATLAGIHKNVGLAVRLF